MVSIRENIIESIRTLINPIQLISKSKFLKMKAIFFMVGVGKHDYKDAPLKQQFKNPNFNKIT